MLSLLAPLFMVAPPVLEETPNVVLILVDDLGWMDLSCQGSPVYSTPNIDRLSAEGVRLESYYVQPLCSPTRKYIP